jgi:hypothetical protein
LEDIQEVRPRRVILNPGSQCEGAAAGLRESGIDVVNDCTLQLLGHDRF